VRKILDGLNETIGIRGSMVVSGDGMVIASCLGRQLDEEKVAAMASNAVMSIRRALGKQGLPDFGRFTLTASHGKLVFTDTGIAYLVVVMDRNIDLGPTDIEIESAAMRIRSLGEMRIG
jgi:predicted regulator of Ras-like GTPase activity (Roadblock/LC7/MglB family)